MNFLEIKQAQWEVTGYDNPPPTAVVTRTGDWINQGYRRLLRLAGLTDVRPLTMTFSTANTQKYYAIAQSMERIDEMVNTTQQRRMDYMTRDEFRAIDPGEITTGSPPTHWVPWGYAPVLLQPSSTGLWAASSAAGDTTQTVTVQGITVAGVTQSAATAVLTGTTRVALGAVTTYVDVLKFNLSATAVGTVSLFDAAAAGNTLGTILIGDKSVQYQIIRLWPTATATETITVDGQTTLANLSADTDIPILPTIWHDLLVTYAEMMEYKRAGNASAFIIAKNDWDAGSVRMRSQIQFPPDYRPVAGVNTYNNSSGWNGLTGYFPAD